MTQKTRVEGNRVIIDEIAYLVEPAGDQYFSVKNEFGESLGYLRVRGKVVTAEEFERGQSPSLALIGRLWLSANEGAGRRAAPPSKGVCHIEMHEGATDEELEEARVYRAWLKRQPGIRSSYHARDPATGKAVTISFWQTKAHLEAALKGTPEGTALKATSTETYPYLEEP